MNFSIPAEWIYACLTTEFKNMDTCKQLIWIDESKIELAPQRYRTDLHRLAEDEEFWFSLKSPEDVFMASFAPLKYQQEVAETTADIWAHGSKSKASGYSFRHIGPMEMDDCLDVAFYPTERWHIGIREGEEWFPIPDAMKHRFEDLLDEYRDDPYKYKGMRKLAEEWNSLADEERQYF